MSKQDNKSYLMLLSTIQRIIHLKLQGFSVPKIAEMQNVEIREVRKLLRRQHQDSVFACDAVRSSFRTKISNEKPENKIG